MEIQFPESERRWLHAVLVLGTLVLALILIGQVAEILVFFSDLLLILLLAWLLAFMISPLVNLVLRAVPFMPRVLVVGAIYTVLIVGLSSVVVLAASSLARSIENFVRDLPSLQARLPELLAPIQDTLRGLGFEVDLIAASQEALVWMATLADDIVGPLTDVALASVGMIASLLIVIFLSLFIVLEKDRLIAYLNKLVPPRYSGEARLFETSVAGSFGGFLRGQFLQGVIYASVAVVTHLIFGLDFLPASAALVGVLQAIPFFGPFVSWAPPVVIALLTRPEVALPVLIIMAVGWFVVMNIIQPKVMASAVGISPVAVFISVLIGLKLAGIAGAIFALPFAAVLAAFFHHFLERSSGGPKDVTSRAARRVEERQGRRVRVPTAPAVPPAGAATEPEPALTPHEQHTAKRDQRPAADAAPGPLEPAP